MQDLYTEYALGIDLGTTYSCVSVFKNGVIEIIPNEINERTTPSIVTFLDNNKILAGEQTLNYEIKNPKNTVYSIKRLIGKEYNDDLKKEIEKEKWPFEVVKDNKSINSKIKLEINNDIKYYYPEEISSFVLKKLLKSAEEYLEKKVDKAVITIPHNFSQKQRDSTKKAAEMAGIKVLGLLSEPTAASLAYGLEKKLSKLDKNMENSLNNDDNKYILTFDLGGGTFDITLLKISEQEENIFDIKQTSGNSHLGGDDFDNKLVDYCLDIFCQVNTIDKNSITSDKLCMKRLKKQCESAKRILSAKYETNIYIDNFLNENDLDIKISRAKFEELCLDLFNSLLNHIEEVLKTENINKSNIKEVVLIGGSTKIPKVKDIISNYFNNETRINCEINPDEAVAYGAGIYAAKLMQQGGDIINDIILMDITPLSIGTSTNNKSEDPKIKALGNLMSFIIPKGTRIPITLDKNYLNIVDNQKQMEIDIYEGERKYTKDNHLIGKFDIELPPGRKGEVKIKVSINIDINGILNIKAFEKTGKLKGKMRIRNDRELISEEDFNRLKEKNKDILDKVELSEEKNYKKKIRDYYHYYLEEKDNLYKIKYLKEYSKSIIQFIETFEFNNFNNVTLFEKFYLYVKLLFESYQSILKLEQIIEIPFEEEIKNVSKKYLKLLIKINPYCLLQLISLYKDCQDSLLYDIVIYVMNLYYENGLNYLNNQKYNCNKYRARNEFVNCVKLSQKLIEERKLVLLENLKKSHDEILNNAKINIDKIDSSFKFNINLNDNLCLFNNEDYLDKDSMLILLGKYREYLETILNEENNIEIEAILLANIVKIQYTFLQKNNYDTMKMLAEQSVNLAMSINKNWDSIPWFKEIKFILDELRQRFIDCEIFEEEEFEENILEQKKEIFEEIENYCKKDNITFIKFIIERHPPKKLINLQKSIEEQWKENQINLVNVLCAKYNQTNYPRNTFDEKVKYAIVGKIQDHLNQIYHQINPNQHVCDDD